MNAYRKIKFHSIGETIAAAAGIIAITAATLAALVFLS